MMNRRNLWLGFLLLALTACDSGPGGQQQAMPTTDNIVRLNDPILIAQGQGLYRQHCLGCHGVGAMGADQWRKPDAEGFYPPPPLNGSGHAWHHSVEMLHDVIKNGSLLDENGLPRGKMPAWGTTIDDREIDALIHWFQSLWPDPIYTAWVQGQRAAMGAR